MANDVGEITVLESETGKRIWQERVGGLFTGPDRHVRWSRRPPAPASVPVLIPTPICEVTNIRLPATTRFIYLDGFSSVNCRTHNPSAVSSVSPSGLGNN